MAVQTLGVAYLLWLASKLARATTLTQANASQLEVSFWQGVLLQFLNIKAWMLALTVVAGWLAGRTDAASRFAIIFPILLAFGLCSNLSYAPVSYTHLDVYKRQSVPPPAMTARYATSRSARRPCPACKRT